MGGSAAGTYVVGGALTAGMVGVVGWDGGTYTGAGGLTTVGGGAGGVVAGDGAADVVALAAGFMVTVDSTAGRFNIAVMTAFDTPCCRRYRISLAVR